MYSKPPLPGTDDLQHLLTGLLKEKYARLEELAEHLELPNVEAQAATPAGIGHYADLSTKLRGSVLQYLRMHRLILSPYIHDLLQKEEDGHDCRACGESCSIQHAAHIESIRQTHLRLSGLLKRLHAEGLALYSRDLHYPDSFRRLHAGIAEMEPFVSDLIFIEETVLIPMMLELQRNIGAHE